MTTNKTTCQICERDIKQKDGDNLAHHGYQRPGWGHQTASCAGARRVPWEMGKDALEEWVVMLAAAKKTNEELAHGPVDKLYLRVGTDYDQPRNSFRREVHETVTETNLAAVIAKHRDFGHFNRSPDVHRYDQPNWAQLVEVYRQGRRDAVKAIEQDLQHHRTRLRLWKQTLKPTKKAG